MEHQLIITLTTPDGAETMRAADGSARTFADDVDEAIRYHHDVFASSGGFPVESWKVEAVPPVPDGGVVVTRPELDRALSDAINGGVGILINDEGRIVAGRPPLHALRRLWPDVVASLRKTGHAWLQRTEDPAGITLVPTGTIRVELDRQPAPVYTGVCTGEDAVEELRAVTGNLGLVARTEQTGVPLAIRERRWDPATSQSLIRQMTDQEWIDKANERWLELYGRDLTDDERHHLAAGGSIHVDTYSDDWVLTEDAPVETLADGRRIHVQLTDGPGPPVAKPGPAPMGIDVVSNGQPGGHGPDGWEQDPKPTGA